MDIDITEEKPVINTPDVFVSKDLWIYKDKILCKRTKSMYLWLISKKKLIKMLIIHFRA